MRDMNISRLSSSAANAQPAAARPAPTQPRNPNAAERGLETGPHSNHSSSGPESGRVEQAPDHLHDHSQRVANFTAQIENRLQHAIRSGDLSEEQIQGLKDAAAQFTALMNRIGNAQFADSPQRQVLFALHQLGNQIQGLLGTQDQPESTNTLAKESGASAGQPAPSVDTVA